MYNTLICIHLSAANARLIEHTLNKLNSITQAMTVVSCDLFKDYKTNNKTVNTVCDKI